MIVSALLVLLVASGTSATKAGDLMHETFDSPLDGRWISSDDNKYAGQAIREGNGLVLPDESKHYGISRALSTPWKPGQPLVVQYELTFTDTVLECAGAYLKLLSGNPELSKLSGSTPFTVMFGPDKCGSNNKVHLILQHKNPVTGKMVEHHLKKPARVAQDKLPHLYTLVLRSDNTFSVHVDQVEEAKGSLNEDFDPPFTPPKLIPDPDEKKPTDWVDEPKMPDPEATKPEDWDEDAPREIPDDSISKPDGWMDDEPLQVPDPDAYQPDDWSEEDDGPWEAPIIDNKKCGVGCGEWKRPNKPNPDYKGKWSAPMIDNPEYKGEWKPQDIDNPEYFECEDPVGELESIGALAVEVWVHKPKGIKFSNMIVGTSEVAVEEFGKSTWKVASDEAKAKAEAEAEKAAEEARRRRIEEGGITGKLEGVAVMASENPMISIPLVLILFFFMFKACCGGRAVQAEAPAAAEAEGEAEAAPAEGEHDPLDAKFEEYMKEKGSEGLKKRKSGRSSQAKDKNTED